MTRTPEEREQLYRQEKGGHEYDVGKLYRSPDFDVDLFFMYLEEGRKNVMADDFFEKKHKEYHEWL